MAIDFLKYRIHTALLSLAILAAFAFVAVYRYQTRGAVFTYSVDFTGGTQVLFKFDNPIESLVVKDIIAKNGWLNPSVRVFGDNEILVRVKEYETEATGLGHRMREVLQQELPESRVTLLQTESVGAGIGAGLRGKSIRAVLLVLLLMLLYIGLRFWSFAFAAGAVAALIHDGLMVLALFLFLDREISNDFIAAVLAVLGYSINDTIIIFSQMREFLKRRNNESLYNIVNKSLNYTLRRTLLTSFSTGLPVIVMVFFGGEALRDFSLALLVGIFFGATSSIYVASPIMMLLYPEEK
jgi:preprotein translocase subunit SecF